ncbi:MAG: ATP-binding protein [Fluviicola sp.]
MFLQKIILFNLFLFFLIVGNVSFAQSKYQIDSLNELPFPVKVEKSGTLDKAYLASIQSAKKLNYKKGEALAYSNLSLIYYYQGDYEKDVAYSLKAIKLFDKIGDKKQLAHEFAELGYRMKRRNMKNAQAYMLKGKAIAETENFEVELCAIYDNYGVLKEMQIQNDSALYFYQKALSLKEKLNDKVGIPYSLNNIAGVYLILKKFSKAKVYYDQAYEKRIKLRDQIGIAENQCYYGDFYFAQNNYAEAIKAYDIALYLSIRFNYPDLAKTCYQKLSECYEKLGDTKKGLEFFKKYTLLNDSLVQESTQHKIAELEVQYDTNEKEKSLLEKEIQVKKSQTRLLIVSASLLLVFLLSLFIYRQQKLKNKQQKQEFELQKTKLDLEKQLELEAQRLQISRDLHDNVGAQLTFIISSVENLSYGGKITDENSLGRIAKISQFTKSTIIDLRDTIWAMNSGKFTFADFKSRLTNFISKAQFAKEDIHFSFEVDSNCSDLEFSSTTGIHLYRVVQEAVNNAMKYADPKTIRVSISKENQELKIQISDDGLGFNPNEVVAGNGLYNMQKRIDEINGTFKLTSTLNNGTIIALEINELELIK